MRFTTEQLDSFMRLYEKVFDEKIDRAEAQEQATKLVSLVRRVYRPMSKMDFKKYSNKKLVD